MAVELIGLPRLAGFVGWDVCAHPDNAAMINPALNKNPD